MPSIQRKGFVLLVFAVLLLNGVASRAQINTAQLSGEVLDAQGLGVAGATVTVKNLANGVRRSTTADNYGHYQIMGLPPGRYEFSAIRGTGLGNIAIPEITLTIGQVANLDVHMQVATSSQSIVVSASTDVIETASTEDASTIDQRHINNLPINGRDYVNFALTNSETHRDNAPVVGPAPTSGLNFNGMRGRSNSVSVDGADAVDNSVNGIRATVSQEAVQEFQVIQNNYMPEFGRAIGGVINIASKSGSNEVHGDVFGFLRLKALQSRDPFSFQVDPASGALLPVKQSFTRIQTGATIGGPIRKDKTFYFFSFETTRRHETGFSSVGEGNFGMATAAIPCLFPMTMTLGAGGINDTTGQLGFYRANLNALTGNGTTCTSADPAIEGQITGLEQAALITSASSNVALNADMNKNLDGTVVPISTSLGIPSGMGSEFFPPAFTGILAPLPTPSFVGLLGLRGNYPVSERTSFWSGRLDNVWNSNNTTYVRVNVSPSSQTGLQGNGQNQVTGQNAYSRTSVLDLHDFAIVAQHSTVISSSMFNEIRFQFARRSVYYGFSQDPGGGNVGVDILGVASFGREPFSTLNRIERRWQWTDDLSWTKGRHTFKFGVDTNLVQLRSNTDQIFQLDFGGDYSFGALSSGQTGLPTSLSAVQAYGLGVPGVYDQGVGSSGRTFDNSIYAAFIQDSWKLSPRLLLNYGIRYDVELTPSFTPRTSINSAAEAKLGVVEGLPPDLTNFGPRIALAWDPSGSAKTVVRAGYGMFYDHPPLAVAFLSATADGAQSSQLTFIGGVPSNAALTPLNAALVLNASTVFQGLLNGPASMGFQNTSNGSANQQRFDPFLPGSFFTNQNFLSPTAGLPLSVLPYTYPVAADFKFGRAQQGTLSIERQIGNSFKFSVGYTYVHATRLNRPRNINVANASTLIKNFANASAVGLAPADPRLFNVPTGGAAAACPASAVAGFPSGTQFVNVPGGGGSLALIAPGVLAAGFTGQNCAGSDVGYIGTPAVFNFFRPSGPNPSFGNLASLQQLAGLAGFPMGPTGVSVPYSDVNNQESTGSSIYHGLTVALSKRFTNHFEFLTNWTWSHAIDDSTDLQALLEPMDNNNPQLDRSSSTFDQRHRWVTAAVFDSPFERTRSGFLDKLLADFTLSPMVEVASGRPYNVLTGTDYNMDFNQSTDRPSVVKLGTAGSVTSPYLPNVAFALPSNCVSIAGLNAAAAPFAAGALATGLGCVGNLGRNAFTTPGYFTWDMRVSRRLYINERLNVEAIADVFNLFNRTNVASVNVVCDPGAGGSSCSAGQPTASFDPRQFQFAMKVNF